MKTFVLELCAFGILSSFLQCILPQGMLKKTAMFACSLVLLSHFLSAGYHTLDTLQWTILPANAQVSCTADSVLAEQVTQSILQDGAECLFQTNTDGKVERITVFYRHISTLQKQSITQALCGIYDIDETAIDFVESG